MTPRTTVEILNKDLEKVCEVRALYPLTESGLVLRYSRELSDYGSCEFRISTKDPLFSQFGDVTVPHKYHIRLKRGDNYIWQGAVVDNPSRNRNFVEVRGAEYEFYLSKVLVKRTSAVSFGSTAPSEDIGKHFRIFSSGTMATAVTNVLTEAKAALGSGHLLSGLTLGTIENPDFPKNFVTAGGSALTGAWTFSDNVVLQFDYHTVLYVLQAFGIYASADFEMNDDLDFTFKKFLGNKNHRTTFVYGSRGNISDYDVPRLGSRVVNDLYGIGSTPDGTILHSNKTDEQSRKEYGLMQDSSAFADVKDKNILNTRLAEQLRLTSSPEVSPINLVLNEKAYPLGRFQVGDVCTVKIKDGAIDYEAPRRIVGFTVNVHNTGREVTTIQTNAPRDEDIGS